jgi:hypothetical protein
VDSSGVDQYATIPTLHEWMNEFAADPRLQLIVLDLKLVEVEQADYLVEHIMSRWRRPVHHCLPRAEVLSAASKIRLLSPSYEMVAGLQSALARAGWDRDMASRVLGGTVGTIHLGHDSTVGFDPVASAAEECYGLARSALTPALVFLWQCGPVGVQQRVEGVPGDCGANGGDAERAGGAGRQVHPGLRVEDQHGGADGLADVHRGGR